MHLISATLTEAAYEIRSGWPSRQKSANTSAAIIFYEENGPSNLAGLWQQVATRERYIRELESEVKRYRDTFGSFNPSAGLKADGPKS
jgi:hypothetical protein